MPATDYLRYDILNLEQIAVLSSKNIVDSPHCACGAVETTKHYFFECQRYNEIISITLNELGNYCVPDFITVLFGIPTTDFNTNNGMMITVQKHKLDSKWFEH